MKPTFSTRPSFLGVANESPTADYVVAGIPFDIGTTHRAGSRFGPMAIRAISRMLVDGANPQNWHNPQKLDLADVGDFDIALGDTEKSMALIEQQAAKIGHLITLGGDHSIALPLLRAASKRHGGPLGLVHFDAHVDTWPDSFGQPYGHGSCFYHAINEGIVDPARMIQIGIRSPLGRDVYDWTVGKGVRIISAEEAHEMGPAHVAEAILERTGKGKSYLTFDIDCIDPSQAPGTGTPEIGGLTTLEVRAILMRLAPVDFVGMDIVEVAPPYDVAEITALAGATVAWLYLSLQAQKRGIGP
ncbi:agmatinase [Hypericibacter adhaerens]|uniref:Agmatinase n=2 Tax=Hypericibacter adhaerens TaxID=2602016 RepID=A0A5J6N5N1_9PROT|nr:agmatinase [Hypericibacter adhaerens]